MSNSNPRVFIVQENEDANTVLNGTLWLKGLDSFKFTNGNDCLEKIKELEGKVDAVIIGGSLTSDIYLMLIVNIKKINDNIKVLVIAVEDSDKTRILGYGADAFSVKPMTPENVAERVLMLLSREAIKGNR